MAAKAKVSLIPHSWAIPDWPDLVYPGCPNKGKYIVRAHRDELRAAGALSRVGRDLIVFGAPYAAWLASHASRVNDFEIAPNRARDE